MANSNAALHKRNQILPPEGTSARTNRLMSVRQLSAYLGIHPQTIYRLCRTNSIPHIRLSERCVRFDPGAIESWLRKKRNGYWLLG